MRSSQMRSECVLMLTVIVVVVKDCLFFVSFILCENCEFVKWMCWMLAFLSEL